MPDVYTTITQQPREVVETLAHAMETRAASSRQRDILDSYLSHISFSGPITEVLAQRPEVEEVVGVDPSPVMLEKARELRGSIAKVSFQEGDGQALIFDDETFDVAVLHTILTHIPDPEAVISKTYRVLRPAGWIAIYDGDYETITISNHPQDPLGTCVENFMESYIKDLYIVRKLSPLVTSGRFRIIRFDSHRYVETSELDYLLTIVDRGADSLVVSGSIGEELSSALKTEARRRIVTGEFFGHLAYTSIAARKEV
jgi:SAM-dependent methyltransferase